MAVFKYKAIDNTGRESEGSIDAVNVDVAISSLQRRGLTIASIQSADKPNSMLEMRISLFDHIPQKDIVIFSRQIATLFEAQVSALRAFRLLSSEATNINFAKRLAEISDDLQGGTPISKALEKHGDIFSNFYVAMVRSGEESGKLNESFQYLADYLDRNFEITNKVKNALIYPAFVIFTFVVVMILMLTVIIPKISAILLESGTEIPIYTKIVLGISNFFLHYGVFLLAGVIIGGFFLARYARTEAGKDALSEFKLQIPALGNLYQRLYLSRISDNFSTLLSSGIPIIRAIEITGGVVDNRIYERVLMQVAEKVRGGAALSEAMAGHEEVPGIMVAMIKVGEEAGQLGKILKTMSRYYTREVSNAVDTMVDLIEPALIVLLGLGVGVLLASVLIPIYSISSNIT